MESGSSEKWLFASAVGRINDFLLVERDLDLCPTTELGITPNKEGEDKACLALAYGWTSVCSGPEASALELQGSVCRSLT